MINGLTQVIAHIGYPTQTFKSPMIYNPYFVEHNINAVVVPFACQADNYPDFLRVLFRNENVLGALITMPHKVSTINLLDRLTPTAQIAGACNAVRRASDGQLEGDMFDGEGFVLGMVRKGFVAQDKSALVVGNGGVGSAIAASLGAAGVGRLALFDPNLAQSCQLAARLRTHYPNLQVETGAYDLSSFDLVVNASPLGMYDKDPLPVDVTQLSPHAFVGDVVLSREMTPFLLAAQQRGCTIQVATDMLFEQIPAYLTYFGLPSTTPETLRRVAKL